MKIKVTLERPGGATDLVLTADADATVGDVADALARRDPGRAASAEDAGLAGGTALSPGAAPGGGARTLSVAESGRVTLDPDLALADSGIKSGVRLAVIPAGDRYADKSGRPVARITVLQGPDSGRQVSLGPGNQTIGRSAECDLRLTDTLVSRRHVRVFLGPGSAEVLDLGSANGLLLNDGPVTRGCWLAGDRLGLGDTILGIEFTAVPGTEPGAAGPGAAGAAGSATAHAGQSSFNRSPVVSAAYPGETFTFPEPPETERGQRFPVLALAAPVLMGGILFAITRSVASLAFVALSPMMMLANVVEGRWAAARGNRTSMATFRRQVAVLDQAAEDARAREWRAREAEHPAAAACLDAAIQLSPLLWSRRPQAPGFLDVRVGTATLPSRIRFDGPGSDVRGTGGRQAGPAARAALGEVVSRYRDIDDVPFALSLPVHGAVGIAGDPVCALGLARAVACQVAALHSPAEVVLAAFCGPRSAGDWDWLKWLPHTSSPHSPLAGPHLVAGPESAALLAQLESLGEPASRGARPAVVVFVDSETPADRARLVELSKTGPSAGVYFVWLAPRAQLLPAACTAYAEARSDGSALIGDSISGTTSSRVAVETVSAQAALSFGRMICPLVDAGAVVADDSDLPRAVSWLELSDPRLADEPAAVIERWQESTSILTGPAAPPPGRRRPGSLRAVVGAAADGPYALDLRVHGPHALLGGTTGAGKSELLRTWILAMAAAHSPQRVNFLLVDYKGGSAFRDCVHLPHTVGQVTDLSPHLVRRALVSLGAELVHRERLLERKGVTDLEELEKTGDPETPPILVIVVDEFAALVQEVPAFVDGVVNVAQRGRSLGLHLVLATQRPAGVIKDNLRANTNLRLALRMADESDSSDVLGSPEAARTDPAIPGRAVSKTGPGRLVPFQAAYVGGRTTSGQRRPDVVVEELVVGTGRQWQDAEPAARDDGHGPTDIARITRTIKEAAGLAQLPPPRRPWLSELADVYDLARLPSRRRDDELVFGVVDEPSRQRQDPAVFRPDRDGNLAIFGTGGAGKSTVLRSLAISAAFTVRGGPCQVYGLDFSSRGLDMLTDLPHVGAVIPGDEQDRVRRLLRTLLARVEDRARRYAAVRAGSVTEYRQLSGQASEPRILLLVDGFPAFRQAWEMLDGGRWFDAFTAIATDGRPLGIHVVLAADRPSAMPARLSSAVQRRLIMRLADENEYVNASVDKQVLGPESPAGRAVMGQGEVQVAVFGGSGHVRTQATAIAQLAQTMRRQGVPQAPRVERLPELLRLSGLPVLAAGRPVIGLADDDLGPFGFRPEGVFLISGPPSSGRTTALATVLAALTRAMPSAALVYFGGKRSPLIGLGAWQQVATDPDSAAEVAAKLEQAVRAEAAGPGGVGLAGGAGGAGLAGDAGSPVRLVAVMENITDFVGGAADMALASLVKTLSAHGHLVVAEAEVSALGTIGALLTAVKNARGGLALQPEPHDGQMVYKTDFPKSKRGEFPAGRGLLVESGRVRLVQIAIPE